MTTYHPAAFAIDGGPSFPGVTDGRTWNGWARPLFTLDTMRAIREWLDDGINPNPLHLEGLRAYMVEDGERSECVRTTIGGITHYSIDGWCWEETEQPTEQPPRGGKEPQAMPIQTPRQRANAAASLAERTHAYLGRVTPGGSRPARDLERIANAFAVAVHDCTVGKDRQAAISRLSTLLDEFCED